MEPFINIIILVTINYYLQSTHTEMTVCSMPWGCTMVICVAKEHGTDGLPTQEMLRKAPSLFQDPRITLYRIRACTSLPLPSARLPVTERSP